MECEKCHRKTHNSTLVGKHTTKLLGGVVVDLCTVCHTEWEKFCRAHPLFVQVQHYTAREAFLEGRAKGGQPPSEGEWFVCIQDTDQVKMHFHAIAEAWLNRRQTDTGTDRE